MPPEKKRIEDSYQPSDKTLQVIAGLYENFYKFRTQRGGAVRQVQYLALEDYWKQSRDLFWNSSITKSDDLKELGLDFALPFIRKEVMDFTGRIVSMGISPKIMGDGLDIYGVKILHAIYKKWRLKNKEPVEKFWQLLYGVVNGTVCVYYGWDGNEKTRRYLRQYNPQKNTYQIEEKKTKKWDDVFSEVVPIEDIYLSKIWQRDIQKQGITIRKAEVSLSEFKATYGDYQRAGLVVPGNQIAEDSLFFTLLGGSGILTTDKIQILTQFDTDVDEHLIMANGIWLNPIAKDTVAPNPFHHKSQPYGWTIMEAIDEKFAYGLSTPFKLKDTHKLLNTTYTLLLERELRTIDPPILTSDFEAPKIIFGGKRVIPVNDVNAYKELNLSEASNQFFTMQNSLQGMMSSFGQGGFSQIQPSRQPKSAREIIALESLKTQSLGNTLVMYYDLVFQEIFLVLKTALQFYESGKYSTNKDGLIRTITVPNFSLTQGGIGNMEVRIVKEPQNALKLYFEAVNKSIENGKATEIIELPVESLQKLEFFIDDIILEPKASSELEKQAFFEQVIQPMLQVFVPAGIADVGKVFLRWLEKNGEHPSDYVSDQNLPNLMASWGAKFKLPVEGAMGGGAMGGNLRQSTTGTRYGSQSNGGLPADMMVQ